MPKGGAPLDRTFANVSTGTAAPQEQLYLASTAYVLHSESALCVLSVIYQPRTDIIELHPLFVIVYRAPINLSALNFETP